MQTPQVLDLQTLIEQSDWTSVRETVRNLPHAEIAEVLFELELTDRMVLFRLLPHDISADVFAQLEYDQQNTLLEELTLDETRSLLAGLSPDDRTALFEELPGQVTQKLLNLLAPGDLAETRKLLGYPPESVGRLMTPDYVAVRPEWTIEQVLQHLRKWGKDSETINAIYVTDKSWKLLDALGLKSFILASPQTKVEDLMDYNFVSLTATQDREEAVRTMERYDLAVVPVVDTTGVLVGIVTFDDVLDVAEIEATEDFHKVGGVNPIRGSYRQAALSSIYRKRIGWLLALVFANLFSGAAIASFEDTIAANVALVIFLPLLIGSSGNAGSQAATLVVRALAMGDAKLTDGLRLLLREIVVASSLGFTMALCISIVAVARGGAGVGLVVAVTMVIVVVMGSTVGTLLPLLLTRFKLDPAVASAPLVTSLSDVIGVLIYLGLATAVLGSTPQVDEACPQLQADALTDVRYALTCDTGDEFCVLVNADTHAVITPHEYALRDVPAQMCAITFSDNSQRVGVQ